MLNRITRKMYRFPAEFQLADMDHKHPAGRYEVKSEDQPIGDVMFSAYRRISTTIYIPPSAGASGIGLFVETTPSELAAVAEEE